MRHAKGGRKWAGGAAATVVTMVIAAALVGWALGGSSTAEPTGPAKPSVPTIFAKTIDAANPAGLVVSADGRKILGWISGTASHAGSEATIRMGDRTETVIVQRDNTFTWHYKIEKDADATVTAGQWTRMVKLRPAAKSQPSVFFVVDRTAYRPGQKVQFVGFLRELTETGRFEPLKARTVTVELRSVQKNTVATKLKLTSDDLGRIEGEYTFNPEDALDGYTLSIPGHAGKATIKLAEFRKAKVRLDVAAAVKDRKLTLTFKARDFLNKSVSAKRVDFTATLMRKRDDSAGWSLNAKEFAHYRPTVGYLPPWEGLTERQRVLLAADGDGLPVLWQTTGPKVLMQTKGQIDLAGKSDGEYVIDLQADWLGEPLTVHVQAVLIDQNDREQRAAKQIALGGDAKAEAGKLRLALGKKRYFADEPVNLSVDGPKGVRVSVVAMKMTAQLRQPRYASPYQIHNAAFPIHSNASILPRGRRRGYYRYVQPEAEYEESLVTATIAENGLAVLKLDEPGAYRLVAIAKLPDGKTIRKSIICGVRDRERHPALVLELDKNEYRAGETLTGVLHSRFKGAKVLLTLSDSTGIRLWGSQRTAGAVTPIAERLPTGMAYGCVVTAHYVDKNGRTHVARRNVRVVPTDRMVTVKTEMKEIVKPGEPMEISLTVNRNEPVDLVVSVYDESLLGIAADRGAKVESFYLADERALVNSDLDLLRLRLGGVTVQELLVKMEAIVKQDPKSPAAAGLQDTINNCRSGHIREHHLAMLLNVAGIRTRSMTWGGYWYTNFDRSKGAETRLADLIQKPYSNRRLVARVYDDLVVLAVVDANGTMYMANHGYYGNGWGYGYNGQLQMQQFRGYRSRARGDSHFSASANSMVSGQSFISHMPVGPAAPAVPELTGGGDVMIRRDFSDLAYFNRRVRTDDTGRANVSFKLPDSLTNWRVVVTAVTKDMHVGQTTGRFRTYKPVMVWPMIPQAFTEGDKIRVFARVHNRTEEDETIAVDLAVQNGEVIGRKQASVKVPAGESGTVYWTFAPGTAGYTQLLMTAKCEAGSDASLKRLPVVPACNVESTIASAGFCKGEASIEIPDGIDLATGRLEVTVSPSMAADMVDTLDYLVAYPHGCVEQTMSRFLPAVKVAGILKAAGIKHAALEKKLPGCVAGGIKRLIQLQRPDGGWGWNGNSATHEMMTPYALFGLMEAEKAGYTLGNDQAITRGIARLKKFITRMGTKQATDRIYCMYIYGYRHKLQADWWKFIDAEVDARRLSDYALAMSLELAVREGKTALAKRIVGELHHTAKRAGEDVYWTTANFSRWGNDRHEITAAVMKALVAHDPHDKLLPNVLGFFARTKNGRQWGSTKSTAMVLFAICELLTGQDWKPGGEARVRLAVNGGEARTLKLTGALAGKVVVAGKDLKAGKNVVRFDKATVGTMYRLVFRYRPAGTEIAPSASGMKVVRQFFLLGEKGQRLREIKPGEAIERGSYVESLVTASIADAGRMRYCLVTNGKPSGSQIVPATDKRFNQSSTAYVLREDTAAAVLYHHEQTGRSLNDRCVLYAELAGEFVVPPAAAELMYRPDIRGHSGTFRLKVVDKEITASSDAAPSVPVSAGAAALASLRR